MQFGKMVCHSLMVEAAHFCGPFLGAVSTQCLRRPRVVAVGQRPRVVCPRVTKLQMSSAPGRLGLPTCSYVFEDSG